MQQELRSRGCDARVFRIEREAERWLRARKRSVRRSIGELAVL
jgi:hypothetical protein